MKIILTLILTLLTIPVFAADGDLDPVFGTGGIVTTAVVSGTKNQIKSVAVQPDGKIVAAGSCGTGASTAWCAARYDANGSADLSFGQSGKLVLPLNSRGGAMTVIVLANGKIIFTGAEGTPNFTAVRLNADGTFDATFDGDGIARISFGSSTHAGNTGFVQSDGKIVVAGHLIYTGGTNIEDFAFARFNADGSPDTSFDGDGKAIADVGNSDEGFGSTQQPDGKILLTGYADGRLAIVRLNTDGSLDTSFDGDGKVVSSATVSNYARDVAVQNDGKIIAVGTQSSDFLAERYNPNGSLDTSFGTGGRVITTVDSAADLANDVLIQPDGKFILSGRSNGSTTWRFALARYTANGSLDSTFGTGGIVITQLGSSLDEIYRSVLQPDGKIIAAGYTTTSSNQTTSSFALARYTNTAGTQPPVNNPALRIADFDGDGKTDASVFRNGTWFINPSTAPSLTAPNGFYGVQFGLASDTLAPADYDGDGKTDIAVWRSGDFAYLYILQSSTGTVRTEQFGTTGDNPTISGDWDGDGKADPAVYRAGAQSYFYYRGSLNNPNGNITYLPWGTSGDTPIFGDFDGDRKLDATIYRPSENAFWVRRSSNGSALRQQWGSASDDAIFAGDFDGDGKSDFAVYRFIGADAGTFYILQSGGSPAFRAVRWGLGSDLPVPADYDGDGKTDFAVYRRSNAVWYVLNNASGAVNYINFGSSSDFPLPLNYVR